MKNDLIRTQAISSYHVYRTKQTYKDQTGRQSYYYSSANRELSDGVKKQDTRSEVKLDIIQISSQHLGGIRFRLIQRANSESYYDLCWGLTGLRSLMIG